jgi:hypothetical protein
MQIIHKSVAMAHKGVKIAGMKTSVKAGYRRVGLRVGFPISLKTYQNLGR